MQVIIARSHSGLDDLRYIHPDLTGYTVEQVSSGVNGITDDVEVRIKLCHDGKDPINLVLVQEK